MPVYRELAAFLTQPGSSRSRELGLLEGLPVSPHLGVGTRSGARWTDAQGEQRDTGQSPRLVNRSRE